MHRRKSVNVRSTVSPHNVRLFVAASLVPFASACATSRAVAPLERGQHGIISSLGGPLVQFGGAPIPLPIASVGYRYGIDGKTDIHSSVYISPPILFGVGGIDVGAARELVSAKGARPRLMVDVTAYSFFGNVAKGKPDGGFRLYPDVTAMLTWDLGEKAIAAGRAHHLYVGLDNFFQPFPTFHYYLTPIVGAEVRASKAVGVQLELGWSAPWVDTTPLQPVWYGPGNLGAASFKIGINGYFTPPKTAKTTQGLTP